MSIDICYATCSAAGANEAALFSCPAPLNDSENGATPESPGRQAVPRAQLPCLVAGPATAESPERPLSPPRPFVGRTNPLGFAPSLRPPGKSRAVTAASGARGGSEGTLRIWRTASVCTDGTHRVRPTAGGG